jgi:hypothetical protein
MEASPFILATSRPVLTFGGFSGGDPVVDTATLAQMVADGEVAFVLDNGALQQRKPEIYNWLQASCTVVEGLISSAQQGQPAAADGPAMMGGGGRPGQLRLYDCSIRPS